MQLDGELCKKPGRSYNNERRVRSVAPQDARHLFQLVFREVVRNDESVISERLSILSKNLLNPLEEIERRLW